MESKVERLEGLAKMAKKAIDAMLDSDSQQIKSIEDSTEWLTTKEAAEYLNVTPKVLLNMCCKSEVLRSKLGRRNRYRKSDLRNLLLQRKERRF